MATIKELQEKLNLKALTEIEDESRKINGGCVCDLLSWVMARGEEGMAWVTVQTHLNVVAVACLHDFSCVIIPESIEVPKPTLEKAAEEGIVFFSSPETSYEVCCAMFDAGVVNKKEN